MGKVRESQRRAADAWDAKNMRTIACKMRKNIADDFIKYAQDHGTTPSALIKSYVLQCLGRTENDQSDPPETTEK